MIKGVNRQIIEVHDTGSKCFDKVLLFVNSDFLSQDESKLKNEAKRIIRDYVIGQTSIGKSETSQRVKKQKERNRIITALLIASAFFGAIVLAAIQSVI